VLVGRGIGIDTVLALSARTLALPVPELQGVPLGETLVVPAVGAEAGQGEVHPPVELELLGDYLEGGGALLITFAFMSATNNLVKDVVFGVFDVVW